MEEKQIERNEVAKEHESLHASRHSHEVGYVVARAVLGVRLLKKAPPAQLANNHVQKRERLRSSCVIGTRRSGYWMPGVLRRNLKSGECTRAFAAFFVPHVLCPEGVSPMHFGFEKSSRSDISSIPLKGGLSSGGGC